MQKQASVQKGKETKNPSRTQSIWLNNINKDQKTKRNLFESLTLGKNKFFKRSKSIKLKRDLKRPSLSGDHKKDLRKPSLSLNPKSTLKISSLSLNPKKDLRKPSNSLNPKQTLKKPSLTASNRKDLKKYSQSTL